MRMLHLFRLFQRWYENLAINADIRNQRCDYIHWFDQDAPGDELEAVSPKHFWYYWLRWCIRRSQHQCRGTVAYALKSSMSHSISRRPELSIPCATCISFNSSSSRVQYSMCYVHVFHSIPHRSGLSIPCATCICTILLNFPI